MKLAQTFVNRSCNLALESIPIKVKRMGAYDLGNESFMADFESPDRSE